MYLSLFKLIQEETVAPKRFQVTKEKSLATGALICPTDMLSVIVDNRENVFMFYFL